MVETNLRNALKHGYAPISGQQNKKGCRLKMTCLGDPGRDVWAASTM